MRFFLSVIFCCIYCMSSAQGVLDSTAQDTLLLQAVDDSSLMKAAPISNIEATTLNAVNNLTITKKKKKYSIDKVRILFGVNYSFYQALMTERDIFQGVYYPVKDSAPVWTERDTKNNLAKQYKSSNFQFSIQGNVWKGLFVGMHYQFFSVKQYKKDENRGNLLSKVNTMFFIASAQIGYVFEFLKDKTLQLHPSIRIGGFTADDYYDSGKGKKLFFGTDIQLRYLIKRKAGFSLGFDYDFLHYKQKDYTDIFHRKTYQKTSFSNFHLNAGVFVNVSINTKK